MPRPKTWARSLALQAMYQWHITGTTTADLLVQFQEYDTWRKTDAQWFHTLILGTVDNIDYLNKVIANNIDRTMDKIDLIELAILRIGVYELKYCPEIPYKVIINEYVNLSKIFGTDKSYRYINAMLDKIAAKIRVVENTQL